jgi:hypothetical protein
VREFAVSSKIGLQGLYFNKFVFVASPLFPSSPLWEGCWSFVNKPGA